MSARGKLVLGEVRLARFAYAVDHPDVSKAMRFIRDHAVNGIRVDDVANHIPQSRRTLERAFVKTLRRSIHEEITRIRIERAKQLLRETDLSIAELVMECGYRYPSQFSAAFRKATGFRPRAFRQERR
jgi:LacI family transcriptional regulator